MNCFDASEVEIRCLLVVLFPFPKQKEGASKTMMEKQVAALNNTLINFFKGTMHNPEALSQPYFGQVWG